MDITIIPSLWFDGDAATAAEFYASVFPDSRVIDRATYPEGTPLAGQVVSVTFELAGQRFVGINGGPQFPFTEAVSFMVPVETQDEVDHYWNALLADGGEESQCGWLKDRFGLSWQIVPEALDRYLADPDRAAAGRVMQAMLRMRKIVIADLDAAYAGE
ncbi:VOC family protein [Agromyces atrinae]|uniref:Putative 3-demethylubiquinone-9 3-methyltransferase (Glyoxalase superfamily) n=1 Tax=Agromyces atrinae TaxID=592376 RepID=A0A4Q2M7Z6_9MICO|nr:VOC family protein [Agromyces atrinae]NYD66793.1 putative 3-demethylubiquinone-9 3-methyltransferase (glyoxalase superfamily) [Agromyces atrinae]RXZ87447.1 VOC family protein [Agromyces atrinae]